MTLDVVVPALRTRTVGRLLHSLALGTSRPDAVTLVSNEVPLGIEAFGLPVRVIRFRSDTVPAGHKDVALRRNIGIWASACHDIVTLDDDLVAAASLVATSRDLLRDRPYFWGHHRYVSFADHRVEDLVSLPPDRGRPREFPPNAWHLWMSCYGGLFGAPADVVREVGGFDLVFSGRQASEDQQFGKRLARRVDGRDRVFIHEPPFAWHPTEPEPWDPPAYCNVCLVGHQVFPDMVGSVAVHRCSRCPWIGITDESRLFDDTVNWPYDPGQVELDIIQLRRLSTLSGLATACPDDGGPGSPKSVKVSTHTSRADQVRPTAPSATTITSRRQSSSRLRRA